MSNKIKVNLLTNYSGDSQYSMLVYAAQLEKSLGQYFMDHCQTAVFSPMQTSFGKNIRKNLIGKKLDSYWNRFVKHPIIAKSLSGGINHIIDHNNSYLIKYLDPSRTVITCHDLIYFVSPDRKINNKFLFPRHIIRKYIISGLKSAAKIIADSENSKKDIMKLFDIPFDKITVIYPGIKSCFYKIENEHIFKREKKRLGFNWDKTILHVGENLHYKNINVIFYSLKTLHERNGQKIHFVKVGKDFTSQQKDLIRKIRIGHYDGAK